MLKAFLVGEWYKLTGRKRAAIYLRSVARDYTQSENARVLAGMALEQRRDRG